MFDGTEAISGAVAALPEVEKDELKCAVTLLEVEKDGLKCAGALLEVEKDGLKCAVTLLEVEKDELKRALALLEVEKDGLKCALALLEVEKDESECAFSLQRGIWDVAGWGPPSRRYFFRRAGPSKKAALVGPSPLGLYGLASEGGLGTLRAGAPLPAATFFAGRARQKKQLWSAPALGALWFGRVGLVLVTSQGSWGRLQQAAAGW